MSKTFEIKKTKFGQPRSRRDGRDVSESVKAAVELVVKDGEERSIGVESKEEAEDVIKDVDSLKRRKGYKVRRKVNTEDGELWVTITKKDEKTEDGADDSDASNKRTTTKRRTRQKTQPEDGDGS